MRFQSLHLKYVPQSLLVLCIQRRDFLAMALWLRGVGRPAWVAPNDPERRRGLRAISAYVATYYALWALADVLILVFGLDLGWLLRVIPNQLYYAFFLPFAWFQLAGLR